MDVNYVAGVTGMDVATVQTVMTDVCRGDVDTIQSALHQYLDSQSGPFQTAVAGWADVGKQRGPKKVQPSPILYLLALHYRPGHAL